MHFRSTHLPSIKTNGEQLLCCVLDTGFMCCDSAVKHFSKSNLVTVTPDLMFCSKNPGITGPRSSTHSSTFDRETVLSQTLSWRRRSTLTGRTNTHFTPISRYGVCTNRIQYYVKVIEVGQLMNKRNLISYLNSIYIIFCENKFNNNVLRHSNYCKS